jgi:dihydroorotate dehydrogenase electron transfer subunit
MKQYISMVVLNEKICNSMYLMELQVKGIECGIQPGQFFTIRVADSFTPFLRRPFAFSAFDQKNSSLSCIYQIRGIGTDMLSKLGKGAQVDIIAPLGNPFPLPQNYQKSVLIAGGIGLGPILFLSDVLTQAGFDIQFIYGCRSESYVPKNLFKNRSVVICSDDGSIGFTGTVADYLTENSNLFTSDTVFYCCGPEPMLRACHNYAFSREKPCYVSVEQVMACGVGACMGCAVKVHGEKSYVRACSEGPVFNSKDIKWE